MKRLSLALMACWLSACAASSTLPSDEVGRLQVVWSVDVDHRRPLAAAGYSLPAITAENLAICGRDKRAHIFNRHGSELRRIPLSAPCDSGALALSNGLVVVGDSNGVLYGIDAGHGNIIWKQKLSSVLLGRPVAAGDDFLVQTSDNRIYRFSSKGEKRWSYAGQLGGLTMHMGASPLVSGDRVYAIFSNGDVVALKLHNGDLLWRRQLILDTRAAVLRELKTPVADPVLVGNVLIVAFYQGELLGLSSLDGERLWTRNISVKTAPIFVEGYLYVAASDGAVLALNPKTGESLWRQKVSKSELAGPTLIRNRLIVADDAGMVYAINLKGRRTGVLKLDGRVDRKPLGYAGGFLIRNDLGSLYLIR